MYKFSLILLLSLINFKINAGPRIVSSIYPIASLVQNVVGSISAVEVLVKSNTSPHHYNLKPSDIRKLKNADLVFIVGQNFETFINSKITPQTKFKSLIKAPKIKLLNVRSNDCSCGHEHANHHDLHFWGSPYNAKVIVNYIADELSLFDPKNKNIYFENAKHTIARIDVLDTKINSSIDRIKRLPFLVFHDGYQYFEQYYGLNNVGIISLNHNNLHSAKTIGKIISTVRKTGAKCIFAEPQYSENVIQKIASVTGVRVGYLDIEGGGLNTTKSNSLQDTYFNIMEKNVNNFTKCFT